MLRIIGVVLTAFAIGAGCVGCGSHTSLFSSVSAVPSLGRQLPTVASARPLVHGSAALADRPHGGPSWMLPDAKGKDLLYVGDIYDVTVYAYPDGKLEGRLRGFYEIGGECVDRKGDVFVVNTGDEKIVEYAHGGKAPIASLQAAAANPIGCAVDPTTGDLAVSGGDLAVYPGAKAPPKIYADPNMSEYGWCAYDTNGNLYVDGVYYDQVAFAELSKGSDTLTSINLDQTFADTGGIQWHGKLLAVGDQSTPRVYEFRMKGTQGTEASVTQLGSGAQAVHQFLIHGHTLIAPNFGWAKSQFFSDVLFYRYPAGGDAYKTITKGVQASQAVVISPGRQK